MIEALTEVPEATAEGKVKTIYDDLKSTLRSPLVPLVFRVLASSPDYIEMAWRALKPNAQTLYFEESADELRSRAVERAATLGQPPSLTNNDEIRSVLRVFQYLTPKVLLAVAALRAATGGQQPKLSELPTGSKRQIAPGLPEGVPNVVMIDPDQADQKTRSVLEDITSTLKVETVGCEFQALAEWPDYLEQAWQAWKPAIGRPEYTLLERELLLLADDVITRLPYRMELYPHNLRLAGLSDHDLDAVQSTLRSFYTSLLGLTGATAFFMIGAEGAEAARQSPFPPTVL